MKYCFFLLAVIFSVTFFSVNGQESDVSQRFFHNVGVVTETDSTIVHDPVMIREDGVFYLFTTGWGISVHSSVDMLNWKREMPVFNEAPQWAVNLVPDFKGHIWAPDIAFFNNRYYVYYSVSSFGKNTSAIGVATNKTLNPQSSDFQWIDHGLVVQSIPGETNWNAIDANIIFDDNGTPYMSFGSFWGGLVITKLTPDGLALAQEPSDFKFIANRGFGSNAIEAPFIFNKDGYYYLFASFDFCCRGLESTYKVVVGRSKNIAGEYFDAAGISMLESGGTLVVEGDQRYAGVGHNAVVSFDGLDYLVFHAYDLSKGGGRFLRIEPITWVDGWPTVNF